MTQVVVYIYREHLVMCHHLQFSSSSAIINFQFSDDTIDTDAATSTTTATTTDAHVTWMCPICGLNVDNMDEHFETHV